MKCNDFSSLNFFLTIFTPKNEWMSVSDNGDEEKIFELIEKV